MPMEHVKAHVDAQEARRRFTMKRWAWFRRCKDPDACSETGDSVPFAECLWLPWFRFRVPVTFAEQSETVQVGVDGLTGAFAFIPPDIPIDAGNPPGDWFRPTLTPEEAAEHARDGLMQACLGRRGRKATPPSHIEPENDIIAWPYWTWYYRRHGGLDIRLLDAVNGASAGNRLRTALLQAFVQAQRSRSRALPP